MKQLFAQIESELASHPHGWCNLEKAQTLASAVLALRPSLVVEIGVWAGRSLVPMALALKRLGKGKLIGIDPWRLESSVQGITGENLEWWKKVDHEMIFGEFTKWMTETGIGPFVEIHRCRSDEFNKLGPNLIDLLNIDGNHGEEASVYDVRNFASQVRVGGLLFFDDIEWAKTAVSMLPTLGFQKLYYIDGGIMCQRLNYEVDI
jgi:predicted O-methyltransferase YrrM